MARPYTSPADTNAASPATPDSGYQSLSGHWQESNTARSAGLRAVEQLRKRLDTIDEHARELRSARHILLGRERLLAQERNELIDSLNTIEAALMTRLPPLNVYDYEEAHEFETPPKRQAISDSSDRPIARKRSSGSKGNKIVVGQSVSKPTPLTALRTEPTLIMDCPPHLLGPSESLPRPPSSSPPHSFVKDPSPRPGGVTRNGIRFPPGSAPRASRGRSSSPLTQMLPPPIPPNPATPVATKGFNPMIRDLNPPEFEPSATPVGSGGTHDISGSPSRPKLAPETGHTHADPPRLSRPLNGTIPIYLILNSSSTWSMTHIEPERTPSPPIGAPHSSWGVRPDVRARYEGLRESAELEADDVKFRNEKAGYELDGPASRTRARVNGGGTAYKGKGRL